MAPIDQKERNGSISKREKEIAPPSARTKKRLRSSAGQEIKCCIVQPAVGTTKAVN